MSIPKSLARKALWNWERLPYTSWRSARTAVQKEEIGLDSDVIDTLSSDIDEWILRNERALRDDERSHWTRGLVKWSLHSNSVFPGSSLSSMSRVLKRELLSGFKFLDEMRPAYLHLQPSLAAFHPDVERYRSSDIDIYIYDLNAKQANAKVEHIFQVWKSNLPPAARDKTLVVRNSRTITFFSQYPIKRVQIVMKLVKSPKHVLLNFDLDVCSMGWDGQEVWLLPRAVRALETGYNVFTMNMIEGHYLGERRATQEQRVFKYADKGYGIRILPSYLEALSGFEASIPEKYSASENTPSRPRHMYLDLNSIADRAARWTQFTIKRYLKWGYSEEYYPRTKSNPEGWVKRATPLSGEGPHLIFNHDMLEERSQKTSEPSDRSCLSGFELLMRHVELWREKVRGNIIIQDHSWASVNYDVGPTGYDDTPLYQWNADFSLEDFKLELDRFNGKETEAFLSNVECHGLSLGDLRLDQGKFELSWVEPSSLDKLTLPWGCQYAGEWKQIDRRIDEYARPYLSPRFQITVTYTVRWWDRVHEVLWSFYRSHDFLEARDIDTTHRFYTEISRRATRPTPTDEFGSFTRWVLRSPVPIGYSCAVGQGFWGWGDDDYDDGGSTDDQD
ncbi:hypothetical protein BS47DRAFT_1359908 [Hydnum rufescens UP504]|uniref:Uncharacterized protein n=1 Tax=Hydnum rufescens UP504 TaxID=1448309 RepID=A0A9P6B386_9AGAM|nr:hypothetical protein BS47DRAFT_1359908 [Hydnum rufescens UP504]